MRSRKGNKESRNIEGKRVPYDRKIIRVSITCNKVRRPGNQYSKTKYSYTPIVNK